MQRTGFPSPARNYEKLDLDFNKLLIDSPSSTFFFKTKRDYKELGLKNGDIIIVDRSKNPKKSVLSVVLLDGRLTIKDTSDIKPETEIFGKITYVIRKL
ncbi:peptidase S24 and S26 domain protein [Thermodesulfobium narugense DSM 14796]|uniref:Peptidase S24 and S26 domain protein n=1 Tax=Thermodesulfobium narugense DSM 14796 TaxID=747365 RepID=M1E8I2_9BACT|nr:S24 family peptidase [Thermodesulfobium narugense]AEE15183.1 peptidase S24 and S26 domain protein [Thermodesulfobium narugense DSM 14796]